MTTHLGVRHMETDPARGRVAAAVVAAPVGALCVRYVKIYFGMLTLAFGMVFYTFLLKFYKLTGGTRHADAAAFPPGQRLGRLLQDGLPGRPYYYFSVAVLAVATLLMWRVVPLAVRPLPQDHPRQSAQGREPRRERAALSLVTPS